MPKKYAICLGFGDQYTGTGFSRLPFAYKNVLDLSKKLTRKGYLVFPVIPEQMATRQKIKDHFAEKIAMLQPDDWLLFYYIGHGDIKFNLQSGNRVTTYLVTSFNGINPALGHLNFFLDDDYANVVAEFEKKAPNGHLITILDCCYAFGLIDGFHQQKKFHSIIAASSFDRKAFYDTNSFFFEAFKTVWDNKLLTISRELQGKMQELYPPSKCQCQIASGFSNIQL